MLPIVLSYRRRLGDEGQNFGPVAATYNRRIGGSASQTEEKGQEYCTRNDPL